MEKIYINLKPLLCSETLNVKQRLNNNILSQDHDFLSYAWKDFVVWFKNLLFIVQCCFVGGYFCSWFLWSCLRFLTFYFLCCHFFKGLYCSFIHSELSSCPSSILSFWVPLIPNRKRQNNFVLFFVLQIGNTRWFT